jgi:hypothetical protein
MWLKFSTIVHVIMSTEFAYVRDQFDPAFSDGNSLT